MDFSNNGGGSLIAGPAAGEDGAGVDGDEDTDEGGGPDGVPAAARAGISGDIRNAGMAATLSGASETGKGSAAYDGIAAETHRDATNSLSRRRRKYFSLNIG